MKKEDLYDSITNIDDDLITDALKRPTLKKRRSPIAFIVSAAAVFAIVTVLGISAANGGFSLFTVDPTGTEEATDKEGTDTPLPSADIEAVPLARAEYPRLSQYPYLTDSDLNGDTPDNAYDEWYEDIKQLRAITVETENIKGFSDKIMSEYLTGKEDENKAISPLNIFMAFSMLAETCSEDSRSQLLDLLGADSVEALSNQANAIWQKNYRDDGVMKSVMGNSLWLSDALSYNESTAAKIAKSYYADVFTGTMGSEKYNNALNQWINDHTGGLIPTDIETYQDTAFVLTSTLLYNTKWQNTFQEKNTREGVFHSPAGDVTVDFMNACNQMDYYWADTFAAIALRLNIGGKMWFILPDEGIDADTVFSDSDVLSLITTSDTDLMNRESRKYLRVNMSIPKFDVSCQTELTDGFSQLGISDITNPLKADFSSLVTTDGIPVYLDKATHGVRVQIDEEGVSAAAYTVLMEAGSTAPPEEIVDFILDRPFAFAVTLDYNTILFAGVVNTP